MPFNRRTAQEARGWRVAPLRCRKHVCTHICAAQDRCMICVCSCIVHMEAKRQQPGFPRLGVVWGGSQLTADSHKGARGRTGAAHTHPPKSLRRRVGGSNTEPGDVRLAGGEDWHVRLKP